MAINIFIDSTKGQASRYGMPDQAHLTLSYFHLFSKVFQITATGCFTIFPLAFSNFAYNTISVSPMMEAGKLYLIK